MSWFYLALLAPFIYAIVNLLDDNLLRTVYRSPYVGSIISGIFGGLPLLSLFFYDFHSISMWYGAQAVFVGFLTVVFYFCYFTALDRESPSIVTSLLSAVPVMLGVLSFFLLGERLNAQEIAGLALILVASLGLLSLRQEKTHLRKSLAPIAAGAAVVTAMSLIIKNVYDHEAFYPAYMCVSAGMVLGGIYFWLVLYHAKAKKTLRNMHRSFKKYFFLFLITELIGLSAEFVMNLAMSRGPVTVVRTIEGIQPMFVLVIALIFYPFRPQLFREASEGKIYKKIFFIAMIVIGLFLVKRTLS